MTPLLLANTGSLYAPQTIPWSRILPKWSLCNYWKFDTNNVVGSSPTWCGKRASDPTLIEWFVRPLLFVGCCSDWATIQSQHDKFILPSCMILWSHRPNQYTSSTMRWTWLFFKHWERYSLIGTHVCCKGFPKNNTIEIL